MVATSASSARRAEIGAHWAQEERLRLLLPTGGDDRIWPDPVTRRNRYGAPAVPAPDELWFSSSTACAISPRGWHAAGEALERLMAPGSPTVKALFDGLRERLIALYGAAGSQAVLAASGTETELLALTLAMELARSPVTNIVVAPAETGSGVPAAASGRHFLGYSPLGGAVVARDRLAGWDEAQITLETIDIRRPCGGLRVPGMVDDEAETRVSRAVATGAFAVLHVLDASKTGHPGVSRDAARRILARHQGRVLVVVDACQLRARPAQIRRDLESGFAVMITGSKFAAGPAFCGALLLPAVLASELARHGGPAATPLAPYSAALDWPKALRESFAAGLEHPANLGLGLRWAAALAEIEAYEAIPDSSRSALLARFEQAVRGRVAGYPGLALLDETPAAPGLVPVVHVDGSDPRPIYVALAAGQAGARRCHLGQPVAIGERVALRVCASMPMITDAAKRGFAAIEADLDEAFDTWAKLRA